MPRRDYLSPNDRTRFDSPPQLDSTQRLILADLPAWAVDYLDGMRTPTWLVGFILQLGYFRQGRLRRGHPLLFARPVSGEDAAWVSQHLRLTQKDVQLSEYTNSRALYCHRALIPVQRRGSVKFITDE